MQDDASESRKRYRCAMQMRDDASECQSSMVGKRLSRIPLLDFFFHTSIFFHVLSPRLRGLPPPKSLDGGVVGGVIGSRFGLDGLAESSVRLASPLPLEK